MSSKKQLMAAYDCHCQWFLNALDDFSDEQANRRLHPGINHVKYLAGHLMHTQYSFAAIAGVAVVPKWNDLFGPKGTSKARDNYPYPTLDEIRAEWHAVQPRVRKGLQGLKETALEQEFPESPLVHTGIFDGTIGDLWAFLNLHQAYHVGQIGMLRKGFGKETLRYF